MIPIYTQKKTFQRYAYPSTEDSTAKDCPDLHTGAFIEVTDLHTGAYKKDPQTWFKNMSNDNFLHLFIYCVPINWR